MKAALVSTKVAPVEGSDPVAIEEQIRSRAYELFEVRGREAGHELEDWLLAEKEITGQKSHASAA